MRAIIGFLAFQAVLTGTGIAVLRAIGLAGPGARPTVAAIGPAFLTGASLIALLSIIALVAGIPLTLWTSAAIAAGCCAMGALTARRRSRSRPLAEPLRVAATASAGPRRPARRRWALWLPGGAAVAYAGCGVFATARLPSCCDDVQIWSLKGLTLFYYSGLRSEIFSNHTGERARPIYPILQPVLEAQMFRAMGEPALRIEHAELWLILLAAVWTLGYLLVCRERSPLSTLAWCAPAILLLVAPTPLQNIAQGFVDPTASVLFAGGAMMVGLWLEQGRGGLLVLGSIFLGAAANTKDEGMIAALAILLVGTIAVTIRRRPGRVRSFAACVLVVVGFIVPWRLWAAAHGLRDAVTPPIPQAFTPGFLVHRLPFLHEIVAAMIAQSLSGYGWIGAIFIVTALVALVTRTAPAPHVVLHRWLSRGCGGARLAVPGHAHPPQLPHPDQHATHGEQPDGARRLWDGPPPRGSVPGGTPRLGERIAWAAARRSDQSDGGPVPVARRRASDRRMTPSRAARLPATSRLVLPAWIR